MEIEDFEQLKKEVYSMTVSLVKNSCFGCKHNCPSLKDHDGCILTDYLEFYIQAIESMSIDANLKEKLKDYFIHKLR